MAYPTSASDDSNLYVAKNNLETLLVGALGVSGGNNGADVEVADTTGFPTTGFITLGNEAISYTSLLSGPPRFSGITRGADGTTAVSHADGSRVRHTQIAAHHNALKEEIKALENDLVAARGTLNDADTPAATASDIKDRLDHIVTQLKSLSGETDWYTATSARVKRSGDTMSGNLAMGGNKVTGLGAANTNGDAVRYEQVNGVYLPLVGGTLTGDLVIDNQKELRLREATAGGTEYVSLKAPAALSANVNLTLPSDTGVSGYALKTDGSGNLSWGQASGGSKNYITNNDAEGGTTGWTTYADAAAVDPVDGTGGSPTVTWTASGSTPLSGNYSFLLTKDAANRQGEGISYNFDVDVADKAKPLYVSFDYLPSANFADNDLAVWLYDRTNGILIQPAPYLIKKSSLSERWSGVFQTASNSTAYRLIIHTRSTSASAYTMQIDSVAVTPESRVVNEVTVAAKMYGDPPSAGANAPIIFPTKAFDTHGAYSTSTGVYTVPVAGYYRVSGTIESVTAGLDLRVYKNNVAEPDYAGFADSNGEGTYISIVRVNAGDTLFIGRSSVVDLGSQSSLLIERLGGPEPVGSSDTRVVAAKYVTATAQSFGNTALDIVNYDTKVYDTHNAVTTGVSWRFTAPVAGYYKVNAAIAFAGGVTWDAGENIDLVLRKNATNTTELGYYKNLGTHTQSLRTAGTDSVYLNAGDYIDVCGRQESGSTLALVNNASMNYISIERISGPAQIAASETVAARYTSADSASVSNNTVYFKDFETKMFDTHGAVTNNGVGLQTVSGLAWKYTAPVSGIYRVGASWCINLPTGVTTYELQVNLYKNNTSYARIASEYIYATTNGGVIPQAHGDVLISLLAGDYIQFQVYQFSNASRTQYAGTGTVYAEILRVGNYV